jgi:hypothetical protein
MKVETKAHLFFFKKEGGRCGCVYGTKWVVDRKVWEPLLYIFPLLKDQHESYGEFYGKG